MGEAVAGYLEQLRELRARLPMAAAARIVAERLAIHAEREARNPARLDAIPLAFAPSPALRARAQRFATAAERAPEGQTLRRDSLEALRASYEARWAPGGAARCDFGVGPGAPAAARSARADAVNALAQSPLPGDPLSVQTRVEFPPGAKAPPANDLDLRLLRSAIRRALHPLHRRGSNLGKCGRTRHGPLVEARISRSVEGKESGHVRGVVRCGSVWGCPTCAPAINAGRAVQLRAVVTAHRAATRTDAVPEGAVYLVTLTFPHAAGDRLKVLRRGMAKAWQGVQRGAPWGRWKAQVGFVGTVTNRETTHGANGFHPHLHILLATARPLAHRQLKRAKKELFRRWRAACVANDLEAPSYRRGISFLPSYADDYIAKFGLANELTGAAVKRGRGSSRTPTQIMADYALDGRTEDRAILREYLAGMKGARQLTWSRGKDGRYDLRQRYAEALAVLDADGRGDQLPIPGYESDTELVQRIDAEGVTVAALPGRRWDALVRVMRAAGADAECELNRATEAAGAAGVDALFLAAAQLARRLVKTRPKLRRWVKWLRPPSDTDPRYTAWAAGALENGGKLYLLTGAAAGGKLYDAGGDRALSA